MSMSKSEIPFKGFAESISIFILGSKSSVPSLTFSTSLSMLANRMSEMRFGLVTACPGWFYGDTKSGMMSLMFRIFSDSLFLSILFIIITIFNR